MVVGIVPVPMSLATTGGANGDTSFALRIPYWYHGITGDARTATNTLQAGD